jgi:hypothetical protein
MIDNKKREVINNLKKPFIIEWWPTDYYAHGNHDFEHYYVKWFCPKRKCPIETDWCESGMCGELPFDNVEDEFEKFDEMGKYEYWKSYGVPEEFIVGKENKQ